MISIIKPRRSGKTSELIKISYDKWYYIACKDKNECDRVFRMAKELGYDIPFPITFSDILSYRINEVNTKGILIENVDMFLMAACPNPPIKGFSFSPDEAKDEI